MYYHVKPNDLEIESHHIYLLRIDIRNENIANKINSGENLILVFYCNYLYQYEVYIMGNNKIKLPRKSDRSKY